MTDSSDPVLKFVETAIPAGVRRIYEVVAHLEFPIADSAAYMEAVESATQRESPELGRFLKTAFSPTAFPLLSAQGALEKLNEALPEPIRIVPSAAQRPRAPIAPWGPRGIYPPGGEILPPWYEWEVCVRQCMQRLESCIKAAGDDVDRVLECLDDYNKCLDRCGPGWWSHGANC